MSSRYIIVNKGITSKPDHRTGYWLRTSLLTRDLNAADPTPYGPKAETFLPWESMSQVGCKSVSYSDTHSQGG